MIKNIRILVLGSPYDGHVARFVKYIKKENPNIEMDLFGLERPNENISSECKDNVSNIGLVKYKTYKIKNKYFRVASEIKEAKNSFNRFVANQNFDIAIIHAPTLFHVFLLPGLKKTAKKIVLTPWGSDVYRVSSIERLFLKILYKSADIVTGNGLRFTKDFMSIYNIPDYKFRCLSLGGDDIDYFMEHKKDFSTNDAKRNFGIDEDTYVITCGYNGNPAQQHFNIIESINKVRSQLPTNLLLLFPFTYGGTKEYRDSVKNEVKNIGLRACYVEEYLDLKELFLLRLATDMFIHIQKTDANNGSLKHYVWLEKNVINGSWLRYDDIESDSYFPYHITPSVEELGSTIIDAYKKGPIKTNDETKRTIERYGYNYLAPKWVEMFESIIN